MVPIDAIRHLREFDRCPGSADANNTQEYWDGLRDHLAKHGFEDPITLEYNNETGNAKIGEGNHRLQVAEELGHTHVPVCCIKRSYDDPRMSKLTEPNAYPSDEYGYFPSTFKPSDIGLPTSGEKYEPAQSEWYRDFAHPYFERVKRQSFKRVAPPPEGPLTSNSQSNQTNADQEWVWVLHSAHYVTGDTNELGPPEVIDLTGWGEHVDGPVIYDPSWHRLWVGGNDTHHGAMVEQMVGASTEFPHQEYDEFHFGTRTGPHVEWYTEGGFPEEAELNRHMGVTPMPPERRWDFNAHLAGETLKLYHGTTNRAVEKALAEGAFKARDPQDTANEVALHYGIDPKELYDHPYFEFSRARAAHPAIYMDTDPHIARSYARAHSEQLEDALHTAHRIIHPEFYPESDGFGLEITRKRKEREQARNEFAQAYHQAHDIRPQMVSFNVPVEALNAGNSPWVTKPLIGGGTHTVANEVPIEWMDNMSHSVEGANQVANDIVTQGKLSQVARNDSWQLVKSMPEQIVDKQHSRLEASESNAIAKDIHRVWDFQDSVATHKQNEAEQPKANRCEHWPSIARIARPADPEWFADRYNVPNEPAALYHGTPLRNLPSVMQHGLVPWDEHGHSPWAENDAELLPRPGHVYLSESPRKAEEAVSNIANEEPVILHINPAHLDPHRVNPDEDAFSPWHTGDPMPNGPDENLGEWADQHEVGKDPQETHKGIDKTKTLAYRGTIPPEALTPYYRSNDGSWQPLPKEHWGAQSVDDLEPLYSAKIAVEDFDDHYYHSAPTADRERIKTHGLIPSKPGLHEQWHDPREEVPGVPRSVVRYQPQGVYLAPRVKDTMGGGKYKDIWRVDPSYVKESQPDPIFPDTGMIVAQHPIPPEALTLHTPVESDQMGNIMFPGMIDPPRWNKLHYERNKDDWQIGQPTSKTAAQVMYHLSPWYNREAIGQQGLVNDGPIYVSPQPSQMYHDRDPGQLDTWAVDMTGLEPEPGEMFDGMQEYLLNEPVGPDRLKLHEPAANPRHNPEYGPLQPHHERILRGAKTLNDNAWGTFSKVTASDWFAPSYMISDEVKRQISQWAQTLSWPEGSKLAPPERYHVTGVYSPSGFSNPAHHEWVQQHSGLTYPVQTIGVDNFSPSKVGSTAPVVLRVHHPQLQADTERLMDEAQERGLPVSRFPGGYKAHITVGHSPTFMETEHPNLSFSVGPLRDLHSYYDELKAQEPNNTANNTTEDLNNLSQAPSESPSHARSAFTDSPYASELHKFSDSWDSREWPDPLTERSIPNPEPQGCTCKEGHKLDCPVHGLNATEQEYDHTWSIPQASPVGYPQDQPRNWQMA